MSMNNGTRLIPAFGNRYHTRSAILTNLAPGQYYWSVQTVDPGFVGSTFSVTGTFRIWAYNRWRGNLKATFILAPLAMVLNRKGVPVKIVPPRPPRRDDHGRAQGLAYPTFGDLRGKRIAIPHRSRTSGSSRSGCGSSSGSAPTT